ncbi:hypothetical protein CEUSTIGMA_g11999.t1 [Chlamydomonas eustigma]|uniref:UspA domain-containing protein n=1 Tax=Chlamydomonas eustigma TaxID=1157962 RepID=A0A250XND4_9CHLO|nr:hypothetical protein CEUSTIGMA_g11999.t1 [Chlamydomonas eustigma]|eukprot:GAX84578.1 hypothetical protein CEUSTIGMA_g11999.t1 [Chlamydomonas eustigma]
MLQIKNTLLRCPRSSRGNRKTLKPNCTSYNTSVSTEQKVPSQLKFDHLLLPILDPSSYLTEGSKQVLATAVKLAQSGKITVLVVDEEGTTSENPSTRREAIQWHFNDKGFENYNILEKNISTPASVLIGDAVDDLCNDLVLISTEAVHAKHVDANQLAEFVSCPVMLIP